MISVPMRNSISPSSTIPFPSKVNVTILNLSLSTRGHRTFLSDFDRPVYCAAFTVIPWAEGMIVVAAQ
jgi:hypothetical protein